MDKKLLGASGICAVSLLVLLQAQAQFLIAVCFWFGVVVPLYYYAKLKDKENWWTADPRTRYAQTVFWSIVLSTCVAIPVLAYYLARPLVVDLSGVKEKASMVVAEINRSLRAMAAAVEPSVSPTSEVYERKKQIEKNIHLYEFYAKYEWSLTGHNTLEPMSLEKSVLRATFKTDSEYRLTPLIRNNNDVIPLYESRITMILPLNVIVRAPKLWQNNFTDTSQTFHAEGFGPVVSGQYRGLNESLFLKFPNPGTYSVSYVVHGIAQSIPVTVQGSFSLEVS